LKPQCTKAARRLIYRSFYEDARETMHRRPTDDPAWMKQRRQLAEHPFGTMKWLVHDGHAILESTVICEYLDEVFPEPPLKPKNANGRAEMRCGPKQ